MNLIKTTLNVIVTLSLGGILLLTVFTLKSALSKNYNSMSIKEKEDYESLQKSLYKLVTIIPEEEEDK